MNQRVPTCLVLMILLVARVLAGTPRQQVIDFVADSKVLYS